MCARHVFSKVKPCFSTFKAHWLMSGKVKLQIYSHKYLGLHQVAFVSKYRKETLKI